MEKYITYCKQIKRYTKIILKKCPRIEEGKYKISASG